MAFSTFADQKQVPRFHRTREIGDGDSMAAGATPYIGQQQFFVLWRNARPQCQRRFREVGNRLDAHDTSVIPALMAQSQLPLNIRAA